MEGLAKRITAACTLFVCGTTFADEPLTAEAKPAFIEALSFSDAGQSKFELKEQTPEKEGKRDGIETDRDSFTPAITTVSKGRVIFESAWTFSDNRGVKETNSFPEALLRYGLTERLELRLGWNYEVGGAGSDPSGGDSLVPCPD